MRKHRYVGKTAPSYFILMNIYLQTASSIIKYLVKSGIPAVKFTPYFPILAACDSLN
jgi:hypothetical protein